MLQKKEIDTLMLPIGKYWLIVSYLMVICLSIAALFIFLGLKYHKLWVMIIGIPLCILPAIFFRLKINLVAKKSTILFSEEFIEINGTGTFNKRFVYSDIKYFSVSKIDIDHASTIKFILENGAKKRYTFFRQFDNDENILNNVLLYFSSYNIGKMQEEKIHILPSFFLTKPGRLFVVITGFSILVCIIIQVLYKPKTIPASLIAVLGSYLQVKTIQMNNSKILKKFRGQN